MSNLHDKEAFFKEAREMAEGLTREQLIGYYMAELKTCCEVEEELKEYKTALKLASNYICGTRGNLPFYAQKNMKVDYEYFMDYFKAEAKEKLKSE